MADDATTTLKDRYKAPHRFAVAKCLDHIDRHGRRFIALSPFATVASVGPDGRLDVSPRGGGPGFVRVADDGKCLIMPDRPGNNRLDTLKNIAEGSGEVGFMFMIPGVDDIYRVNGRASLLADDDLAATFEEFGKVPKTLLKVEIHEAYLHCPKALMRADLWGETHRIDRATLPSLTEMVSDQIGLPKPTSTHEEDVAGLKQSL
jgi:uncharacterized protein